jgi:hypothetical protein
MRGNGIRFRLQSNGAHFIEIRKRLRPLLLRGDNQMPLTSYMPGVLSEVVLQTRHERRAITELNSFIEQAFTQLRILHHRIHSL